jgi:hypothetical protein
VACAYRTNRSGHLPAEPAACGFFLPNPTRRLIGETDFDRRPFTNDQRPLTE